MMKRSSLGQKVSNRMLLLAKFTVNGNGMSLESQSQRSSMMMEMSLKKKRKMMKLKSNCQKKTTL
jgi:hypothetical protein